MKSMLRITSSPNGQPENCPPLLEELLKTFPLDIRTAKKVLRMDADIDTWAACPKCHFTYPPTEYPFICSATRFGRTCQARVCKSKVKNGQSVLVPIKPFEVQNFESFKASLINRPGIEELLDRGLTFFEQNPDLLHLKDGSIVAEVIGPDGAVFCDGMQRSELRLLWSFSADWFNPYFNKTAGKAASIGVVSMSCINLPPALQFEGTNMYLAAIIPGPNEPPEDAINEYLKPIAAALKRSWLHGTYYSATPSHPNGRMERSAIGLAVFDLLARAKVVGHKSHSGKACFCGLCLLSKDKINEIDYTRWPKRDRDMWMEQALAWRDATSKKKRKALFDQNGVRWSPLLELPYFDPTTMVVVDSMHNHLLNQVHHHFRYRLGISEEDPADAPPTAEQIQEIVALFEQSNIERSVLEKKCRLKTLKLLCHLHGLDMGERARKIDMILQLQVRVKPVLPVLFFDQSSEFIW